MQLVIQKKYKNKPIRSWKLNRKKNLYIVGSSRKSDIYFPWSENPIWFGCQFKNNKWHLVNLTGSLHEEFIEKPIEDKIVLSYKDIEVELFPINNQFKYAEIDDSKFDDNEKPIDKNKEAILCIKKNGAYLVASDLITIKKFTHHFPKVTIKRSWTPFIESPTTQEKIFCKIIPLHQEEIKKLSEEPNHNDPGNFWTKIATLIVFILGLFFYLFLPEEKSASEKALSKIPPNVNLNREIKIAKKEKQIEPTIPQQIPISKEEKKPEVNQKANSQTVTEVNPKFSAQSRLAKMIARINNTSTSSKNVIIVDKSVESKNNPQLKSIESIHEIGGSSQGTKLSNTSNQGISIGTASEGNKISGITNSKIGIGGGTSANLLENEADIEGGLDPEVISSTIKKYIGEILFCYERQLSSNSNLYGKVTVRFTINPNGFVENGKIYQTSLKNEFVEKCMIDKIKKWKFPQPKGGTEVIVTYPFLLKNTN